MPTDFPISLAAIFPLAHRQILAAFVVGPLVLLGWGGLFRRLCGHDVRDADDLFGACFEGWALLLGALQMWHLVAPVDATASLAASAFGAVGLAFTRPAWSRVARGALRNLPVVLLALGSACWLAELALGGPRHGDAGGYYIPTTLWMQAHPIVVGLGNLSAPYAYNQSYFLYTAALAVGPFAARPWHLANGIVLVPLVARSLLGWWRLVSPWRAVAWTDLGYALLLPGETALALGIFFTSPAPDTGVFLIGAALLGSLLHVASGDPRRARFHVLAVVLFACAGWTIKVAFAGMAAALLAVVPAGWWWRARPSAAQLARTVLAVTAIALFMIVPWIAANVLMSGCPLFPSALGALDVPWRVHMDVQEWIESDKYMGPLSTLWKDPRWVWQRLIGYGWDAPEVVLPLLLGVAALAALPAITLARAIGGRRRDAGMPWWIVVPPLVSLVFALRLTPMPRYAGATMWLFGIAATLVACGRWLRTAAFGRGIAAGAIVAATAWLAAQAPARWPGYRDFEAPPSVATDVRTLASGLAVHVPRGTDACWAAPLPCAPNPDPRLALRRAGDLGGGFEVRAGSGTLP